MCNKQTSYLKRHLFYKSNNDRSSSTYIDLFSSVSGTLKNLMFVAGQRNSLKLIISGYSFVRNKGNYRSTYWRCSMMRSKKCKAKVVTDSSNSRICMTYSLHNHAPDYSELIETSVTATTTPLKL